MLLPVAAMYERMRADQRKLGKAAWAAAAGRMEQLQYAVSKETLQLMRAKEISLEQRKHGLKEEVLHPIILMTHTHSYNLTPFLFCLFVYVIFLR